MYKPFSDRVAIVTGGSDGIGRATAELLAERGAHVVICARRAEKLKETKITIEDAGGSIETVSLDVSNTDAFAALIHDVAKRQMSGGFGCLLSVLVKGDALAVVGRMKLFHRATSLGGVESLVEHRYTIEPHTGIPENLLRLSIGIEDADDLIADLEQALSA